MSIKIRIIVRHCLDILLFLFLCWLIYAIDKWFIPQKRGFFCNDESLQYPYKASTITATLLVTIVLSVPTLIICTLELCTASGYAKTTSTSTSTTNSTSTSTVTNDKKGNSWWLRFSRIYRHLGYYLFGLALTIIATNITKFSVGRLRPNFFAVCQPQLPDGSNCEHTHNHGRYILDYSCMAGTNVTEHMLRDLAQSFPSGHASIFFYAMTYVALYLQLALSARISRLLKHLLQFACLMCAWYISLTRISDYKHHWSDVVAGTLLGAAGALTVAKFVARLFRIRTLNSDNGDVMESATRATRTLKSSAAAAVTNTTPTTVLPAYTFGTMPYLPAPPHHQYATHTYHNYGYVP